MKQLWQKYLLAATLAAVSANAAGATITVMDDGSGDYTTIQSAVDAAVDGDVILVGEGIFTDDNGDGTIAYFSGKSLEITAVDNGTAVLDGQGSAGGIEFSHGSLALTGLVFLRCSSTSPGGAILGQGPLYTLDITACHFENCETTATNGKGGAVTVLGNSSLGNMSFWFSGCHFKGCSSPSFGGAIYAEYADGIIDHSIFENNSTMTGGAVEFRSGSTQLFSCTFTENDALGSGGAIRLNHAYAELLIQQCDFTSNFGGFGSVISRGSGNIALEDCTIANNTSWGNGACAFDDADEYATASITRCVFSGNAGGTEWIGNTDSCVSGPEGIALEITDSTFCDHASGTEITVSYTDGGGNTSGGWCCPGDIDQDDDVDVDDLFSLLSGYGIGTLGADDREDLARDGDVDVEDLLALLTHWGGCS